MHIATQKASVGMYSECDYPYKSYLCTFWPCHPYLILQFHLIVFILVPILFFIALGVIHQCHLTWFAHSTLDGPSIEDRRCWSSRVHSKFVATPFTFLWSCHETELFGLWRKFWALLVVLATFIWLSLSLRYWAGWLLGGHTRDGCSSSLQFMIDSAQH